MEEVNDTDVEFTQEDLEALGFQITENENSVIITNEVIPETQDDETQSLNAETQADEIQDENQLENQMAGEF